MVHERLYSFVENLSLQLNRNHDDRTHRMQENASGAIRNFKQFQCLRPLVGASVKDQALLPSPRKPGLTLSLGDESPSGKSRGGTPTDVHLPLYGGAAVPVMARHKSLASVGVSLPSFSFPFVPPFVIAGL